MTSSDKLIFPKAVSSQHETRQNLQKSQSISIRFLSRESFSTDVTFHRHHLSDFGTAFGVCIYFFTLLEEDRLTRFLPVDKTLHSSFLSPFFKNEDVSGQYASASGRHG